MLGVPGVAPWICSRTPDLVMADLNTSWLCLVLPYASPQWPFLGKFSHTAYTMPHTPYSMPHIAKLEPIQNPSCATFYNHILGSYQNSGIHKSLVINCHISISPFTPSFWRFLPRPCVATLSHIPYTIQHTTYSEPVSHVDSELQAFPC